MVKVAQLDINAPKEIGEWKFRKLFDYQDFYNYQENYIPKESLAEKMVFRYAGHACHTDLHFLE